MKKKILAIIACVITCTILSMLLSCCGVYISGIGKNSLAEVFDIWKKESDPDIAIFDALENSVIINGNKIYLDEALKDHYENTWGKLILCIRDNKIYGIHTKNYTKTKYTAEIYSIDIKTNEVDIVYTAEFGPGESGGPRKYLTYESVYYLDGEIVMCDGYRMMSYRIDTGKAEELDPDDFSLPQKEYSVERLYEESEYKKLNYKTIKIVCETEEREITLDYMAQRHPYVKELVDMGMLKNPFEEKDPLEIFFGSSYVINEKIYLVCTVLDNGGESNGLVFSYDYKKDQFSYIYQVFSIEHPDIVIIPVE